jgi:hypothetical protein
MLGSVTAARLRNALLLPVDVGVKFLEYWNL